MIQSGDIEFHASQVMSDTSDGGGRMTSTIIVDGQSNNMFPDITELDRTYGNVSLRKFFAGVFTSNTDVYMGANQIISKPPIDPAVSSILFSTRNWNDTRTEAKEHIERYLARGVKWPGYLLERQLAGQRAIALFLRIGDKTPAVGETVVLVQDEAKPTEYEQYVRVTKVSSETKHFNVGGKEFNAVVCTCDISDALRYDFEGNSPTPYDDEKPKAVLRETVVANASVYYGIKKVIQDATIGDSSVLIDGIFGQLVPASQSDNPIIDQPVAQNGSLIVKSSNNLFNYFNPQAVTQFFLGVGCTPNSLQRTNGDGKVRDNAGIVYFENIECGTIDYANGAITVLESYKNFFGYYFNTGLSFYPAVSPTRITQSTQIYIGTADRGNVYTLTLLPIPALGTLVVSYMSQGKWYTLKDTQDVSGNTTSLKGSDPLIGIGTLNLTTGTVIVTTGALPDVYSSVIFSWSSPTNYFIRSDLPVAKPAIKLQITEGREIVPNTLVITWAKPTTGDYEATDDGNGNLIGDATGSYSGRDITLYPNELPLAGSQFSISYQYGDPVTETFVNPPRNPDQSITLTLANGNVVEKSIAIEWTVNPLYEGIMEYVEYRYIDNSNMPIKKKDNGLGGIIGITGAVINYVGGEITFNPDVQVTVPVPTYFKGGGFSHNGVGVGIAYSVTSVIYQQMTGLFGGAGSQITVKYRTSDTPNSATETITMPAGLTIDLTDRFNEHIIPNSALFTMGGKTYVDRLGVIYSEISSVNDSGVTAGALSHATGIATITEWTAGQTSTVALKALLTEVAGQVTDSIALRVPSAPLRPSSFQIRFTPVNGVQVAVSAATNGDISGNGILGSIDYQNGVAKLRFGRMVTAAGNESQPWFDADAVDVLGKIFKPEPIYADTIRYNAVAYTYLPLDADVLGIDPVRLPPDGRVPIVRAGDVGVIHHTSKTIFPNPPVIGNELNVGRVRLASLKVVDAAGVYVSPTMYDVNLNAGTVVLNNTFLIGTLVFPLYAEHRIEDMRLITDAQITGLVSFARPLTHNFPQNETYFSTALIQGNIQARVYNVFEQGSWTNVWSDTIIGSPPSGGVQFNNVLFPITTTNKGSIKERWALIFTSTSEYRLVGEFSGQIGIGNINSNYSPNNPVTNMPYMTIPAAGFGGLWPIGSVLRFNTDAATYPSWVVRTVLQSDPSIESDAFQIQQRGDIDRP